MLCIANRARLISANCPCADTRTSAFVCMHSVGTSRRWQVGLRGLGMASMGEVPVHGLRRVADAFARYSCAALHGRGAMPGAHAVAGSPLPSPPLRPWPALPSPQSGSWGDGRTYGRVRDRLRLCLSAPLLPLPSTRPCSSARRSVPRPSRRSHPRVLQPPRRRSTFVSLPLAPWPS